MIIIFINFRFFFRRLLNLQHHNGWSDSLVVSEQILHVEEEESSSENCSQLSSLNLAHNQFAAIPVVLSCLAVNLTRLNMAYNRYKFLNTSTIPVEKVDERMKYKERKAQYLRK